MAVTGCPSAKLNNVLSEMAPMKRKFIGTNKTKGLNVYETNLGNERSVIASYDQGKKLNKLIYKDGNSATVYNLNESTCTDLTRVANADGTTSFHREINDLNGELQAYSHVQVTPDKQVVHQDLSVPKVNYHVDNDFKVSSPANQPIIQGYFHQFDFARSVAKQ